jgi:hypothetical protein
VETISIVIVSWHPGPELAACVGALARGRPAAAAAGVAVELIVIDNGSPSFPADAVRTVWPDALVEVNAANRGFGPAANQGAALARGEFLLFLNPDTLPEGEPFAPLLHALEQPGVVAAAPRLLEPAAPRGEGQESFQLRRLPSWGHAVRQLLLIDALWPGNPGLRRDRYLDHDRERPFDVEQPAAAALAVRRSVFTGVGGFDERFVPAWFEDVDLCRRLGPRGRIVYWPASRFVHVGGGAARRLGYDRFLPIYYRNAVRYWRTHRGRAAAGLYRLLVATGMLLRLAVLPFCPDRAGERPRAGLACARVLRGALTGAWGVGMEPRSP